MNDLRPWGPPPASSSTAHPAEAWTWLPFRLSPLKPARSPDALDLHLAALEYSLASPITINGPDDIQSRRHWSELVEPYEHQIRNLMTFCRRAPVALIADDVGLGKTISAGLILSELMTRGKVQRALILCPKILMPQWREELQGKFQIEAAEAVSGELSETLRSKVPVLITTYHSARSRLDQLGNNRFDMMILDEAHKVRNLFGTQKAPKFATEILNALQNRAFRFVLMLTATPVQNRLWDIYSLVHCLATAKGHRNPLGSADEFARRFIADGKTSARRVHEGRKQELQSILGDYMVRLRRTDCKLFFPERVVRTVPAAQVPGETDYFRLVGRLVKGRHPFQQVSIAQSAFSSAQALLKQISNMHGSGTATREDVAAVQAAVATIGENGKLRRLRGLIADLREKRPRDWRVILFTTRLETLELIRASLAAQGLRVGTIAGNQARANQRALEAFRADPPEINVIVSTDAGAEGINLQVANVLVNYDLPWNPMVVEQRIGRIQRLASTHRNVIVLNLVTQGTVEESIVSRLIEKLQLISSTIGDIESVLEASEFGDEDGFENTIRDLVLKALENQDVEASVRAAQASIERAKTIYETERAEVDRTIGTLETMHVDGPSFPKLTPLVPRLPVRDFTLTALAADGAQIRQVDDRRHSVSRPGRAPETIVFSRKDALESPDAVFGGGAPVVYERDAPAFERLVGEWASREQQLVEREVDEPGIVDGLVRAWFRQNAPRTNVTETLEARRDGSFHGRVTMRVSASVAHDRYEKLGAFEVGSGVMDPTPREGGRLPAEPLRVFHAPDHVRDVQVRVRDAVRCDPDISAFCSFYTDRLAEELSRVGPDEARKRRVQDHFTPAVTAEVVAAQGSVRETVECEAIFAVEGEGTYRAAIAVEPTIGAIIRPPPLATCEASGWVVPTAALSECAVTKRRVVTHLLKVSPVTGRRASPDCFEVCERTGEALISDELDRSAVSGLRVDRRLLHPSGFTGRLGLSDEGRACDFTGRFLLLDEVLTSSISGKAFFKGDSAMSAVSGVMGHVSEFAKCAETGAWILPEEGAASDVSGKVVRQDLLVQSEQTPFRRGTPSETIVCQVSGKRLLTDEVERSAVSQVVADRTLMVMSEKSGRSGLPKEVVTCEESGTRALCDEVERCSVTGKLVLRSLLAESTVSRRKALARVMVPCEATGKLVLPEEIVTCAVSGKKVAFDETELCTVTGERALRTLMVRDAVSRDWMLTGAAGRSDRSGRYTHPSRLVVCPWTGRKLFADEVQECLLTGLSFDSELIRPDGELAELRRLLDEPTSALVADEALRHRMEAVLGSQFGRVRHAWARESSTGIAVVRVETSMMLGFGRKDLGMVAKIRGRPVILGRAAVGKTENGRWHPIQGR